MRQMSQPPIFVGVRNFSGDMCRGVSRLRPLKAYITNNQQFIPNYGERNRNGEQISTGFVESIVN